MKIKSDFRSHAVAKNCEMVYKFDIDYFINTTQMLDIPQKNFNDSEVSR